MERNRKTERNSARNVRAWEETTVIPTYQPAAPDKNPMFLEKRVYQGSSGKVYPLPFTDRIAEKPVNRKWKAVWLENEFLRVMILPELGGRIHRAIDKTNGYDFIYHQSVIKPALVGLAGPWISGGIEFNWPQHHRPATFLPVDFKIEKHADGSATVWCSDHDPMYRMKGMHGVCLHPGRAFIELKVRAYNRTPFVQTFLWWANVATRVHEGYQSFFPPDVHYIADHARRAMSEYPLAKGFYYGVNYGERGRKGIPKDELPSQFVPPHCARSRNTQHATHIPDYSPDDLSFYANIPTPCSYMCMGSKEDFFGGYDHKAQAGIVHVANHHISPGKKQWTWGNHEFGYAWDRNLTEPDAHGEYGPYIELMAGVYTDNQPDFSFLQPGETKTWSQYWYPIRKIGPAQHSNLKAAVSLRVLDHRIPQTRPRRAEKLAQSKTSRQVAQMGISVTQSFYGARIFLVAGERRLFSSTRSLAPGKSLTAKIELPRGVNETDLLLRVRDRAGSEIISFRPKPQAKSEVPPPATEPPAPQDIASTDELYITGLHLEQYRHATRCPTDYWREGLRRDPLDSRCNNAMGLWHLRRGEFELAENHFRKAIERLTRRNPNPYDGEPFYNLGLCLRYQLNLRSSRRKEALASSAAGQNDQSLLTSAATNIFEEAYAVFYKATWNQAWMSAGYHALAEIDCCHQDWTTALDHLNRSLRLNTDDTRARNLKVLVLRKLNRPGEAATLLEDTLALDPLDWWARHLNGEKLDCDLQTLLDLAHDYARAGFYAEAIGLLAGFASQKPAERFCRPTNRPTPNPSQEGSRTAGARLQFPSREGSGVGSGKAFVSLGGSWNLSPGERAGDSHNLPDQSWGALPLVHYTLGWLEEKRGDDKAALKLFKQAAALPPDYCFPARLEEIAILEAAMRANPKDAKAPYYLGNLLYDRRRHEEAIKLWEQSAKLDPNFSIVRRNLGIAYFNIRKQPARARAAYDKAFRANRADARLLYERDQLWKRLGETPDKRLRELEKRLDLVRPRDDLSVELCALYNQTGQHLKALQLLTSRNFQPWEGGEGDPLGRHVRTHLALGREALAHHDYPCAANHFESALVSPPNLGEAKHLLANQSDIHYWAGVACDLLGEKKKARQHWLAAATFKGDFQEMSVRVFSEMTYYSALAWERLGQKAKAKKLLKELLAYALKLQKSKAKIDYFATSLPTMLLFDDDLQFRQETTALFLQAQAYLGLGNRSKAKRPLSLVLKRDPNHSLAADLKSECRPTQST